VSGTDSEGPWWLVRKGRIEDAKKQLRRLAVADHYTDEKLEETVALMVHTNEMEKAEVAGTGFTDCFKGTNRRRTEIVRFEYVWKMLSLVALRCVGYSILVRQRHWRLRYFIPSTGGYQRGCSIRRQPCSELHVHCGNTHLVGL